MTPTIDRSDGDARSDVSLAVSDLADRLDVDPEQVKVVLAEDVTWPDGSLGCPEPGRFYTQALVDGRRIILQVGADRYHYHSGGGRKPFYCPHPR